MTLPGADTMKAGIMGEDFFRSMAGAVEWPLVGIEESTFDGIVSTGEASGVWVPCDVVERGLRGPAQAEG